MALKHFDKRVSTKVAPKKKNRYQEEYIYRTCSSQADRYRFFRPRGFSFYWLIRSPRTPTNDFEHDCLKPFISGLPMLMSEANSGTRSKPWASPSPDRTQIHSRSDVDFPIPGEPWGFVLYTVRPGAKAWKIEKVALCIDVEGEGVRLDTFKGKKCWEVETYKRGNRTSMDIQLNAVKLLLYRLLGHLVVLRCCW